jgi:uncharacterized protein (TIGR02145 family)
VAAGYVGHCRTNTQPGAGYLYNWPAVMQNQNAYFGSTDDSFACSGTGSGTASPNPAACRGICPEGWHVPTGSDPGEYKTLNDFLGKVLANIGEGAVPIDTDPIHWHGARGGFCNVDGSLDAQKDLLLYWSSTAATTHGAIYLRNYLGTEVTGMAGAGRTYGLSVRCVQNY